MPRHAPRKALALSLLLLHCSTLTADAADRYVNRSTGSNAASGLIGAPWRTMVYCNATLGNNERLIVAANDTSYDAEFNPVATGTTLIGDSTNPARVLIPGATILNKFTTLIGVKFTGGVSVLEKYLHARKCAFKANFFTYYGGARIESNRVGTGEGTCQWYIQPTNDAVSGDTCTIKNNYGDLRLIGAPGTAHLIHWQPNRATVLTAMKAWTVSGNRCTLTTTAGQQWEKVMFQSRLRLLASSDNHWVFRDSVGQIAICGNQAYVVRDSMKRDVFLRDTVEFKACNGPYGSSRAFIYSAGNLLADSMNVWRYCVFKSDVIPCGEASFYQEWQWGARDSIYRNTYLCNHAGDCVKIDGAADSAFFERNTIVNLGVGRALKLEADNPCALASWPGYLRLRGNILVSNGSDCAFVCTRPYSSRLVSDYNLVFGPNLSRNRAIKLGQCSMSPAYFSAPLASTSDTHSAWGSPVFADSSYDTFDGNLSFGSNAIAAGPDGVDCGAFDYVTAAPGAITDVLNAGASNAGVVLLFTAPGANGTTGTASSYEMRYSTSTLAENNFSAGQAVSLDPPQAAGAIEVSRVTGLAAATTYYFAVRASNGSRVGALSNVVLVRTAPTNSIGE